MRNWNPLSTVEKKRGNRTRNREREEKVVYVVIGCHLLVKAPVKRERKREMEMHFCHWRGAHLTEVSFTFLCTEEKRREFSLLSWPSDRPNARCTDLRQFSLSLSFVRTSAFAVRSLLLLFPLLLFRFSVESATRERTIRVHRARGAQKISSICIYLKDFFYN